jgi:FAD/FMN-containing dehydrogenase
MSKKLANIVGIENISNEPLDLEAYSYCSSETELKPALIVWPKTTEQAQRLLLFANQSRIPIIIRGSGTSTVDGCIGENAIVLSSERMNKILKLDVKNKTIEVEAGIRITDLNSSLRAINLVFPLIPVNPVATIGGMIALDAITKESQSLGRMNEWVDEVEFVDGTGKSFHTKKKELTFGQEGISGFITKAQLRIIDFSTLSFDVFSFDHLSELLGQANLLKKDKEIFFLEFIDKKTAQELEFNTKFILVAAYSSLKGKIKNLAEAKSIQDKLNSIPSSIRSKGYYYIRDPCVTLEKTYDLIEWCEKQDVRIHGHIGIGVFYAYFKAKDKELIETFKSFIMRLGGDLGYAFGYGLLNKSFVSQEKKKELIRLKDEYDYNNLLNSNKIINYR